MTLNYRHMKRMMQVLFLGSVITLGTILAACAAPVTFQDGLPPVLKINLKLVKDDAIDPQDLAAQIQQLEQVAMQAKEGRPKTGFLEKFFSSSQKARPVSAETVIRNAAQLRGQSVAVAVWPSPSKIADAEAQVGTGILLIDYADDVQRIGFTDKQVTDIPAVVEGTVEMRGNYALIRVLTIRPSEAIAKIRIARIIELEGKDKEAIKAYADAEAAARRESFEMGAFARISAGRISLQNMNDKVKAGTHYNNAWTFYITNLAPGIPQPNVWMPEMRAKTWVKSDVRVAIGETLDKLNGESFWYKFVAFFVALCGGNKALACLLIALFVRVIIWPLTKKQFSSAEAMKKLQPQMKELQAKYADDKQRFQQEFWKLCQANGVNPIGGCLPLIIQMPVLIMVYKGIRLYIVEFDKSSFLWVNNLAGPDLILLIAYTISMILFQKLTAKTNPQAMDPQQEQQQKMMMYMMPLMFFFMFKTFPAAFILYWLGTNVIYFIQQWQYSRAVAIKDAAGTPVAVSGGGFAGKITKMLSGETVEKDDEGNVVKPVQKDTAPLESLHSKTTKKPKKR